MHLSFGSHLAHELLDILSQHNMHTSIKEVNAILNIFNSDGKYVDMCLLLGDEDILIKWHLLWT